MGELQEEEEMTAEDVEYCNKLIRGESTGRSVGLLF